MTRRAGTPFPFEGPVRPDLLIDRRDELDVLARRAADRVSVRLAAPRRYGKTSLLLAHAAALRGSDWRAVHVDLGHVADLADVARRLAAAYAPIEGRWMRAHLGGLLARLGVSVGTTGAAITVGPRPSSVDAPAAEEALVRLLDLPAEANARDAEPTLVVLDEFQDLLTARDDLDGLVRSRIQYHGDAAAYVFAGSEPSMMAELFDHRERPFFGQADPLALGPLPTGPVVDELTQRFLDDGKDPGAALGELVAVAQGHPQRTMLLAYLLADALTDGAAGTSETAAAVVAAALARTEPAHEAIWRQLRASERAALAAVADGVAPSSPALAAERHLSRNTLSLAARRLVDQGHLARDGRAVQVVDPLLGEWLRRR